MSVAAAGAAAADAAAQALTWTQVAAIGQVASAIATSAAVILTLVIVMSERSIRLRLTAGLRLLIAGDGSPAVDVISISIVNLGQRVARIESVGWRTGWLKQQWPEFLARQYAMQNASVMPGFDNPPFALEPGQKKTIGVLVSAFAQGMPPDGHDLFTRQFPWSRTRRAANICVIAYEVTGRLKVAKVERSLADFLATGKIERGAARFNERSGGTGEGGA